MNNYNLDIYNAVREVPKEAQKNIQAGRLKGMTDINPMWRIKTLTKQFGVCGIGWFYTITDKRLEQGGNNEVAAFIDIELSVKVDGEWSKPIPGTGGSMFIASEKKGLHTSDEAFKMALTDALSVACKALGVGADVYWDKDNTKYNGRITPENKPEKVTCDKCGKEIRPVRKNGVEYTPEQAKGMRGGMCTECYKAAKNGG